jgi:Holliday junction resolvase RusA-like endonuclease
MIHFTLNLKPQPKQRPRVTKTGRAYTPQATREFESAIKIMASEHISEPLKGALSLEVLFVYPRLKSEPKGRTERKYKTTRPDLSNLVKSLEDGLEGVAFSDDAQICRTVSEKIHASIHEEAHIEVTLQELDQYRMRQMTHSNMCGERRARIGEDDDLNQPQAHVERGDQALTRRERSEINRREHRIRQDAKHERMSRERKIRKFEEAQIKLASKEEARKREAEEKVRIARERREQEHQEFMKRMLSRSRRCRSDGAGDSLSGSPHQVSHQEEADDE